MIQSNYLDIVTKFDIKMLVSFFRLKVGGNFIFWISMHFNYFLDSLNIAMFEMEYDRAIELISYKNYSALHLLTALNFSLLDFARSQIQLFHKEFHKAKMEYEHQLESKRVKGNMYECIKFSTLSTHNELSQSYA